MSRKRFLSLNLMILFCAIGIAQTKDVMVVHQADGNEVRFDVTKVERVSVETEPAYVYKMYGHSRAFMSRVSYTDESNTLYCLWEKGDIVKLTNNGRDMFDFVVKSVDSNGVGTMVFEGVIPNDTNFSGTATYAPRDKTREGVQTANNNREHLKYGDFMVATLNNQKIDGANLTFTHPSTAVYKVTFKAPTAFSAGSTLTMGGAWDEDAVLKLNFSAAKGDIVIAYIMHSAGTLMAGGKLKFSLFVKDGDTYSYTFTSAKALTYDADRYWFADISNKVMEKDTSYYVDLGLSVKWATCNLGAKKPEEYGDYYGWGCTEPYATGENVGWPLYFQKIGGTGAVFGDCGTECDPLLEYLFSFKRNISSTKWDAARQKLGGQWRMPTKEELQELQNKANCDWIRTTENGVNGYKVTSKINGNSIFLPFAGIREGTSFQSVGELGTYWSSSPVEKSRAFSSYHEYYGLRYIGCTVRPVID